MSLIFFLAFIGLWVGGFHGLLIGATLGYFIARAGRTAVRSNLQGVQKQFIDSTFAVAGAVCKADGVVSPAEIQAAEELFVRLNLSPEQRQAAKAAFNRGKSTDFDLEAEIERFVQASRGSRALYPLFLRVQVIAVAADGQLHPAEHVMLLRIARCLQLSAWEMAQLEALLRAMSSAAQGGGEGGSYGPPPQQKLDDAYTILGVSSEATEGELKRAYRKLMKENHPDKIASKGLPESMRELAEERAREINTAYDLVKKTRGFS